MGLGVLLAFLAAGCYECGYVLQALEARAAPREAALRAALLAGLASRPRWLGGTALTIAGAALQVAALARAPVTVVQPVLALGLVVLLAFAHTALRERVGVAELSGVAAVVAGVALVAAAGPGRSNAVDSILALVLLLAPLAVITVAPFALRERSPLLLAAAGAAAGDSIAAVALKLAANAAADGRPLLVIAALAGAGAGGGLALTAEMSALRGMPATRVAPLVVTAQVVIPAAAGVAAFGENLSAMLAVGVVAAAVGAALLGSSGAVAGVRIGEAEAVADRGVGSDEAEAVTDHRRGAREGRESLGGR
jgi:drug/metabolite transporter (DMT)-like permease